MLGVFHTLFKFGAYISFAFKTVVMQSWFLSFTDTTTTMEGCIVACRKSSSNITARDWIKADNNMNTPWWSTMNENHTQCMKVLRKQKINVWSTKQFLTSQSSILLCYSKHTTLAAVLLCCLEFILQCYSLGLLWWVVIYCIGFYILNVS